MAKVTYVEVVELVNKGLTGETKTRLSQLLERKRQLSEEVADIDAIIDELLKDLQKGKE